MKANEWQAAVERGRELYAEFNKAHPDWSAKRIDALMCHTNQSIPMKDFRRFMKEVRAS